MRRTVIAFLGLFVLAGIIDSAEPARKAEPASKLIRDLWDAAYLDGARAGYIHTSVREIDRDGKKLYKANVSLDLTLRRFQDTIRQQMESGTLETAKGRVTAVSMTQALGKEQKLALTETVEVAGERPWATDQLRVKVSGSYSMEKMIRWNDQVVGLYREQQLFKEKAAKPGDKFSYLHYEPLINAVVTIQVAVKDNEEVEV